MKMLFVVMMMVVMGGCGGVAGEDMNFRTTASITSAMNIAYKAETNAYSVALSGLKSGLSGLDKISDGVKIRNLKLSSIESFIAAFFNSITWVVHTLDFDRLAIKALLLSFKASDILDMTNDVNAIFTGADADTVILDGITAINSYYDNALSRIDLL